jgi:superfamily II DNA or RNA helicase
MTATLFKIDGTEQTVKPQNGENFTLSELREMLGCQWIEPIYLKSQTTDEDLIMIGDEEARLFDNYVVNTKATEMYQESWNRKDLDIVGNIVLCPSSMLK